MTDNLWDSIKAKLQNKHQENDYVETWFKPTNLEEIFENENNTCFVLSVPTELHKYWISEHFLAEIKDSIKEVFPGAFSVQIDVKQGTKEPLSTAKRTVRTFPAEKSHPMMTIQSPTQASQRPVQNNSYCETLNRDYNFSNFVVGRNNEFAHAACHNIAENPRGGDYNPLFICGPTGMGKTHLINAVANHILDRDPSKLINYVSAERFLNDCVSCLRRREMHKFRKKYRDSYDILIMDDIQILSRGEVIQEEFFHTLNEYLEKGRQVVVASDRMPKDLKDFEDRIRTRLEWGLIADIQMPDIETRMAILNYKAEKMRLSLNGDVINYVAKISRRSIRELEGNLKKIKMVSELQNRRINLELCKDVLSHHDSKSTVTTDDIIKLISDHYKIKLSDIKGKSRTKTVLTARQVGMFLIKKHLDKSLVEIGKIFGGRDHTTVINAIRKIESHKDENAEIRNDINDLDRKIHNLTGM